MFVDEVINEITRVFVLKRFLIDTCLLEELLEIWVDILQVKAMIGVPANVTDVLEIGRHANIFLVQPEHKRFLKCGTTFWYSTFSSQLC